MFENDQGQEVSIQNYFQTTYNYTLRFPGLPCVQVTKKAWYPMEVCTVERGNKYTKKLLPDQVAEALKCRLLFFFFSHMLPQVRANQPLCGFQLLLNLLHADSNLFVKV